MLQNYYLKCILNIYFKSISFQIIIVLSQKLMSAEECSSTDCVTDNHQSVNAFLTKLSGPLMLRRQTGCIYKQQLLTSSPTDWQEGQVSAAFQTALFHCLCIISLIWQIRKISIYIHVLSLIKSLKNKWLLILQIAKCWLAGGFLIASWHLSCYKKVIKCYKRKHGLAIFANSFQSIRHF